MRRIIVRGLLGAALLALRPVLLRRARVMRAWVCGVALAGATVPLVACAGPSPTATPVPPRPPAVTATPERVTATPVASAYPVPSISPSAAFTPPSTATPVPYPPPATRLPTPSPTVPPLTGPLPPSVTEALDRARTLLPEDRPSAPITDLTDALITAIAAFLDQVPDPNQPLSAQPEVLSRLRVELAGLRPKYPLAVGLAAADLDDQPGEELTVTVGCYGLPAWVFRRGPTGYEVVPLSGITPWLMREAISSLRQVGDLTGDGQTEVLVEYSFAGASATVLEPIIARWNGHAFDVLFAATVSQWTAPRTEWRLVARDDAPGFDVELVYPVFGTHDHKLLDHPRGRQRWRWNPNAGRYVLFSESVEEPFTLRHLINLAEARFLAEDYAGALPLYRRVLTDTTLALAPGAGLPPEAEPDWRGYAHFRLGETYALLGDEAAARQELALARQAGGTIARLASAFLSHYTGDASLPAALAATWDMSSYEGVDVNSLAVWSPGTAVTAYLDRHAEVLASGSGGTVAALRAAGVPVGDGLVADLDGDGSPEFAFITWHKLGAKQPVKSSLHFLHPPKLLSRGVLAPIFRAKRPPDGAMTSGHARLSHGQLFSQTRVTACQRTPLCSRGKIEGIYGDLLSPYHHAWLAWREAGRWRARRIDAAKSLALVGTEEAPTGRGLVLLIERPPNVIPRLGRWLWDGSRIGWVDPRTGEVRWPSPWPHVGGMPTWEY